MVVEISDKGYFNEKGESYTLVPYIIECYYDFDYVKTEKYKQIVKNLDIKKRKEVAKSIFFLKTKTVDEYYEELKEKKPISERKIIVQKDAVLMDISYPNLLSKKIKNLFVYNDKYKICGKIHYIYFNKKGEFNLIYCLYSNKPYFFSSLTNFYPPLERLNTSLASRAFLAANILCWILESFGYICKNLYMRHINYEGKNTYRIPYVPKLIDKLINDFILKRDGKQSS